MDRHLAPRLFCGILLIAFVIGGFWYLAIPLAFVCIWVFPIYIEILVFGYMYDSLYGAVPALFLHGYVATLLAIVAFAIALGLKKFVRG